MLLKSNYVEVGEMAEQEIQELPIQDFKEQYGQIPIKSSHPNAIGFTLKPDATVTDYFNALDEGTARFIPRSERSKVADAAVLFTTDGNPVMEMTGYVIRGPGAFYEALVKKENTPGIEMFNEEVLAIYDDLKKNPVSCR